jgi:hypothetical protein
MNTLANSFNTLTERAIGGFITQGAAMQKQGHYREADGTFCRAIVNRNTGKQYVLQGQLSRCAKTGRFVTLKEVMA